MNGYANTPQTGGATLPFTGADLILYVAVAVGLILVGLVMRVRNR